MSLKSFAFLSEAMPKFNCAKDLSKLSIPDTIYEVVKFVLRESCENDALQSVAAMQKGTVVDLTPKIAILASKLSLEHRLPMADSIILATAQEYNAKIWTQD